MKNYVLVSPYDLHQVGSARHLLLAGECVLVTLQPHATSELGRSFVAQGPRAAVPGLSAALNGLTGRATPAIYLSAHQSLIGIKAKCGFVIDGYIAWALKQSGTVIVLGGAESGNAVHLSVVVSVKKRIISIEERVLPSASVNYFADALKSLIEELRTKYPTGRLVQAAPLSNWGVAGVEYIGDRALKGIKFSRLQSAQRRARVWLLPAAVVLAGVIGYAGVVSAGYLRFKQARDAYQRAANNSIISNAGGVDSALVATLRAQAAYMALPREDFAETAKSIAASVQQAGAQIVELKIQKTVEQGKAPIEIVVSLPKAGDSALTQGKQVMAKLANNGLSLRLSPQGWRDDNGRRMYTIEATP